MKTNIPDKQLPINIDIGLLHNFSGVVILDFDFSCWKLIASFIVLMQVICDLYQILHITFYVLLVIVITYQPIFRNRGQVLQLFVRFE